MARLGDILVGQGALKREDIEPFAGRTDGRIGEALRAGGHINARDLAKAVAEQHGLPYVEIDEADLSLYRPHYLNHYIMHRYAMFAFKNGVLTIATSDPSETLRSEVNARYGWPVEMVVTSERDLTHHYAHAGSNTLTRRARLGLRRRYRTLVADRTLAPHQTRGFLIIGLLLALAFFIAPQGTWRVTLTACNLFYLASLAFKLTLYRESRLAIAGQEKLLQQLQRDAAVLNDADLPIYTILVPLYGESFGIMRQLIKNIEALDYPKARLDIKLICEADDATTIATLKQLRPPETMEIIYVPASMPRTKPKACNVAMQQMRGEYAVIYDAEDSPAPDQLKLALAMFARSGEKLGCVQSPLNYYNRNENLLTQLFAIEYSALFRFLLPALERMQLPIPLGGTSNHLRVNALQEAGGWDAFNVTEDADLGIRLRYFGYHTRVLPSLTLEEAPIHLIGWLKQRTRWIKGYIQTWLVYMRDPAELKRRLGPKGYYGFQFFVGAPALTFLLAPLFWGIFVLALFNLIPAALPGWLIGLCAISFLSGIASHWLFARAVLTLEKWPEMRLALLVFPFYWILHSFACVRALWQLFTNPHYWDKTSHGLSRFFDPNPAPNPVDRGPKPRYQAAPYKTKVTL